MKANLVNWLVRQCDIMIRRKCLQIMEKKPGAIFNEEQPKIIFTTMIRRVELFKKGSRLANICSMRSKFNKILNEAAARQDAKIMDLCSCTTLDHFDRNGNLSNKRKMAIWYEIDDIIERYDSNDPNTKLLPRYIPHHLKDNNYSHYRN